MTKRKEREINVTLTGKYPNVIFTNEICEIRDYGNGSALISALPEMKSRVEVRIKDGKGKMMAMAYTAPDAGVTVMRGARVEIRLPSNPSPVANIKLID